MAIDVFDVGDRKRIQATFLASDGIGLNPTAVTLRVAKPDGTLADLAPVADGVVGIYHCDVTFDQAGRWDFRWAGTGAVVAAGEKSATVRRQLVPAS